VSQGWDVTMRIAMAATESAASKDSDATPSACAARVEREATRRGFDQVPRRAVLGAGAPWIWNLAAEHFPGAVQIVDRFHAKPHLSDVGDLDAVLEVLRTHAATHDDAGKCVDYVERNRERMRYPEFRAAGLCASTGVVEAGCKVAIGIRCKRAGMHWMVVGADAIIALRCCTLSGRFEDSWERRSAARAVAA